MKKGIYDCSINMLIKKSAKGRIHVGCSESQEYIYLSVEKNEKIFHMLELKFKIRNIFSASFKLL